jgi:AAA ATPase domain
MISRIMLSVYSLRKYRLMLTKLRVRNFKRFEEVEIELGDVVVLVGPNNAGKTTLMQALPLWEYGLQLWRERREGKSAKERTGVAINRRNLTSTPIPSNELLWRNLKVRESIRDNGKSSTENVLIQIIIEGVDNGEIWQCGLEFYYNNTESFYCRPIANNGDTKSITPPPEAAYNRHFAFLPPMSGLITQEDRLERGSIQRRIGEGRTAEVLRNLCYQLASSSPKPGSIGRIWLSR